MAKNGKSTVHVKAGRLCEHVVLSYFWQDARARGQGVGWTPTSSCRDLPNHTKMYRLQIIGKDSWLLSLCVLCAYIRSTNSLLRPYVVAEHTMELQIPQGHRSHRTQRTGLLQL